MDPKCPFRMASRPPSIWPRELVGDTHALAGTSRIEPWMTWTSGLFSKVVRQAATIFGFTSTRMMSTVIGVPPKPPRCNGAA